MSPESITVYHSTDSEGLKLIRGTGYLIGMEIFNPTRGFSGGSNLTPDKHKSQWFIRDRRGGGQWTDADGPPELFTLEFQLPAELVKNVGITKFYECDECASILDLDLDDNVPDTYLQNLHARTGELVLTREAARLKVLHGELRFYQVPLEFLTNVEPVEYSFAGVTYPLK